MTTATLSSAIYRVTGHLLVASICTVALFSSAFADKRQMTGEEIAKLLPGARVTGTSEDGRTWVAEYAMDGTYTLRVPNIDWQVDGTWRIDGDRWCTVRPQRSDRCRLVFHIDGNRYEWLDQRGETVQFTMQ